MRQHTACNHFLIVLMVLIITNECRVGNTTGTESFNVIVAYMNFTNNQIRVSITSTVGRYVAKTSK
jgi:TRAP-type C4-dicarboxylate transport system permease large subunit